eukprot:Lankesteria_metandrocarpae@DN3878_c0_g1_i2.p1
MADVLENVGTALQKAGAAVLQKLRFLENNKSPLNVFHESLNASTSFFWLVAYAALLQKLRKERSARGVSFQTLFALMLTEVSNVGIMVVLSSQYDVSVSPFHMVCDGISALFSALTYWRVSRSFGSSYEEEKDTFGLLCCPCVKRGVAVDTENSTKPRQYGGSASVKVLGFRLHWVTLYVLSGALATMLHFMRRKWLPGWLSLWECFTDSVTALALLPQLHQFYNRRPRKISNLLARFILFLLLARISSLLYWVTDVYFHGSFYPGRGVHIVAEGVNVLILLDFSCYYLMRTTIDSNDEISLPI